MKSNISHHKYKLAQKAEQAVPRILSTYDPEDLEALGELCNSIAALAEFYQENAEAEVAKRVPNLTSYLDDKYQNSLVLVLRSDADHYGYTAQNVVKFVRGETIHGASKTTQAKRRVLRDYVFEEDTSVECEFQVSWNWIAGPNLRSSSGNLDTGGPFVHSITLNGRKIEVGQIESTILAIAYEFWQATTDGEPSESTKVFVIFNPDDYDQVWGADLARRTQTTLVDYHNLSLDTGPEDQPNNETAT